MQWVCVYTPIGLRYHKIGLPSHSQQGKQSSCLFLLDHFMNGPGGHANNSGSDIKLLVQVCVYVCVCVCSMFLYNSDIHL